MKISDFIFDYATGLGAGMPGICRVRVFVNGQREVGVLLTDLESRHGGGSVTNTVEVLKTALVQKGLVLDGARYIEHYPREGGWESETFDLVTFDASGHAAWRSVGREWVQQTLECTGEELHASSIRQEHLLREIAQIRQRIDPFLDFAYLRSPIVLSRQAQIEAGMLARRSIQELIDVRADERGLQRLLKADLSVFGEVYGSGDEYICFSEFPLDSGFVDFAVFSGRSRMDVTFIEIKGADFNLVNQTGYRKFASKVETAADQIRDRIRAAFLDYQAFRKRMHDIRGAAEGGAQRYNALVGAHGRLAVDPDKDVNVRCVVIGGRSNDDLAESRKRHTYERTFSIPLEIHSWDSWLRRLRRP